MYIGYMKEYPLHRSLNVDINGLKLYHYYFWEDNFLSVRYIMLHEA